MRVSPRACRHCGSPAKGNPCWWRLGLPNDGGDPPCFDQFYADRYDLRDRKRRDIRRFVVVILGSIAAAAFVVWLTR